MASMSQREFEQESVNRGYMKFALIGDWFHLNGAFSRFWWAYQQQKIAISEERKDDSLSPSIIERAVTKQVSDLLMSYLVALTEFWNVMRPHLKAIKEDRKDKFETDLDKAIQAKDAKEIRKLHHEIADMTQPFFDLSFNRINAFRLKRTRPDYNQERGSVAQNELSSNEQPDELDFDTTSIPNESGEQFI